MSSKFRIYLLKRQIKLAISLVYSEQFDLTELVRIVSRRKTSAGTLRALIAIEFAANLKAEKSVSEDDTLNDMLRGSKSRDVINEIYAWKLKAEIALTEAYIRTILQQAYPEYSFQGTLYRAEKANRGPLTVKDRAELRRIASELADSQRKLDEHLGYPENDESEVLIRAEGNQLFEEGRELYFKRQPQEALEYFDKAILYGIENAAIYGDRGSCLQRQEFHLDAIDDFTKAISFDPEDSNLYFMRSTSWNAIGEIERCIGDLQEAMRRSEIDNASNRSHNQYARELGYSNGVIGMYEMSLFSARLDLGHSDFLKQKHLESAKSARRKPHDGESVKPQVGFANAEAPFNPAFAKTDEFTPVSRSEVRKTGPSSREEVPQLQVESFKRPEADSRVDGYLNSTSMGDECLDDLEFADLVITLSRRLLAHVILCLLCFMGYAALQMIRHGFGAADYLDIVFVSLWVFIYKILQYVEIQLRASRHNIPWWLRLRYWTDYCWASFLYMGLIRQVTYLQDRVTAFRVLVALTLFVIGLRGFMHNRNLNKLESVVRTAEKYPDSKREFLRPYREAAHN